MVRAIGKEVPDERLFNPKAVDKASLFHKSCRLAALLHDIGTFPFSHSIEESYIRHGFELQKKGRLPGKQLPSNHEHLGSFIVKNTDFDRGLTRILEDDGIDAKSLSRYIKGEADDMVANQLLPLIWMRTAWLWSGCSPYRYQLRSRDRDHSYHLTPSARPAAKRCWECGKALHAVEDFLWRASPYSRWSKIQLRQV